MKRLIIIIPFLLLFGCQRDKLEIIPLKIYADDGISLSANADSCVDFIVVKNYDYSDEDRDAVIAYLVNTQRLNAKRCFNESYWVLEYKEGVYDRSILYYTESDVFENYYRYGLFDLQWVNDGCWLSYNYHRNLGKNFPVK